MASCNPTKLDKDERGGNPSTSERKAKLGGERGEVGSGGRTVIEVI